MPFFGSLPMGVELFGLYFYRYARYTLSDINCAATFIAVLLKLYRRILLTFSGQRDKVNQSDYTKTIIDALGMVNSKAY